MAIIPRKGKKLNFSSLSVLIVDDQPFYRNLLSEVLRSLGVMNVTTAIDGVDALDALENIHPDIIITDWVMPEMSGLELTERVRKLRNERLKMTPVIMVTSNNLRSQIEEARAKGVDTFILKPVNVKSVFDRMKEVIEAPRDFIDTENYVGPCRRRNKANNYFGPYRRNDDPLEVSNNVSDEMQAKIKIAEILKGVSPAYNSFKRGNKASLGEIRFSMLEIMNIANKINDVQIKRVSWSLVAYIDKVGESSLLRPEIIITHIEALEVLVKTPSAQSERRDDVAKGLHEVVLRSIKAA